MRPLIVILLAAVAVVPVRGQDPCPSLVDVDCRWGFPTGIVWFGLNPQGDNRGVGQQIQTECPTTLLGVDFQFSLPGAANQGVSPLQPGDEVRLALLDAALQPLAVAEALLPAPGPEDQNLVWVHFELGEASPPLEPGLTYVVGAWTDVPAQAGVSWCVEDDDYPWGHRVTSANAPAGPWNPLPGHDLTFRLYLEQPPVSLERTSWSAAKVRYR